MDDTSRHKTLLGADCRIAGEFHLDNDAVFAGHFDGSMTVTGTLDLPKSAKVTGTVVVGRLRLAGTVDADVVAHDSIELFPGAELRGRIFTPRLKTADDCVVDGQACLGPNAMTQAKALLEKIACDESTDAPEAVAASETDFLYSTAMQNEAMQEKSAPDSQLPQEQSAAELESSEPFSDDEKYPDVKSFEVHFSAKDLSKAWPTPTGDAAPDASPTTEADAPEEVGPAAANASEASDVQVRSESVFEMLQRRRPRVLRPVNSSAARSDHAAVTDPQGESPSPPAA